MNIKLFEVYFYVIVIVFYLEFRGDNSAQLKTHARKLILEY